MIKGKLIDLFARKIFPAEVIINGNKISKINDLTGKITDEEIKKLPYIMPGFVDAHIHIESSMLTPSNFAVAAVPHGTIATVSDPHEIANVIGAAGIDFMLNDAAKVPLKFYFSVPSCVPFEKFGGVINDSEFEKFMAHEKIKCLGEVMDFPGVINDHDGIMKKIELAKKYNKISDGHAPGLSGEAAKKYFGAGITTDHECMTFEEAVEKANLGVMVQIREGSAAKNFDDIIKLIEIKPQNCMFCSDDRHPDDLLHGHINLLVKKALKSGYDLFDVLNAASTNAIRHYKLDCGLLRKGDFADFIIVDDLDNFNIERVFINGAEIAAHGKALFNAAGLSHINRFKTHEKTVDDFKILYNGQKPVKVKVIEAIDGQLVTGKTSFIPQIENNCVLADVKNDILKIAIVNRYCDSPISVGFIKNFGMKNGALASSVMHDSHNIIAVGVSDEAICRAVNVIIKNKGGICVAADSGEMSLPLPIAGIISDLGCLELAHKYEEIQNFAAQTGTTLKSPFMTLSFMALTVIPELKISAEGLFDVTNFKVTSLFE